MKKATKTTKKEVKKTKEAWEIRKEEEFEKRYKPFLLPNNEVRYKRI